MQYTHIPLSIIYHSLSYAGSNQKTIPADIGWEVGSTLDELPVQGRAEIRQLHSHAHTSIFLI